MRSRLLIGLLLGATTALAANFTEFNSFLKQSQKLGTSDLSKGKTLCICHATRTLIGVISTSEGLVNGERVMDIGCQVPGYQNVENGQLVRLTECHPALIPGATFWEIVK
jgi:hypothetical protein